MTDVVQVVDPRREARDRVGGRFAVRVLEPSPPTVTKPPWFADDPVNEDTDPELPVLAPIAVPGTTATWDDIAHDEPGLAAWCADRWLGAWRTLALPGNVDALVRTRNAWHVLAEHVVAPARYRATGKIGLRFTRAGFGTPFFGDLEQVRLITDGIVVARGGTMLVLPVTTVQEAADVIGIEPGAPTGVYTPTTTLEPDARLEVDAASARFLGDWFGYGALVLESLRAGVSRADDPARVQLWPEHFDLSVDLGDEQAGQRAAYGASPGDAEHRAPYLYVSPWEPQTGDFWNEGAFASLSFDALAGQPDQRAIALEFFAEARERLGP